MGMYRQKLTKSSKNDFGLRFVGPGVGGGPREVGVSNERGTHVVPCEKKRTLVGWLLHGSDVDCLNRLHIFVY